MNQEKKRKEDGGNSEVTDCSNHPRKKARHIWQIKSSSDSTSSGATNLMSVMSQSTPVSHGKYGSIHKCNLHKN